MIEGELDNTKQGKVTGWMKFTGMKKKVTFDLRGNFHRDIQGAKIRFKGEASDEEDGAKAYMENFTKHQTGKVGDMTAGYPPADYVAGRCYLEWYGDYNGRVVIELDQEKVKVIGEPLSVDKCEPISRKEQEQNMAEFMRQIVNQIRHKK